MLSSKSALEIIGLMRELNISRVNLDPATPRFQGPLQTEDKLWDCYYSTILILFLKNGVSEI